MLARFERHLVSDAAPPIPLPLCLMPAYATAPDDRLRR